MSKQLKFSSLLNWMIGLMILILASGFIAGLLTSLGDYFLCFLKSNKFCERENFFQRLGFYTVYYVYSAFTSGFVIIIIFLVIGKLKFDISTSRLSITGMLIGGVFAWLTKHLIWSIYIQNEKEVRYVVVISLTMLLFPFILKKCNHYFENK